jgi:hypothetical protein
MELGSQRCDRFFCVDEKWLDNIEAIINIERRNRGARYLKRNRRNLTTAGRASVGARESMVFGPSSERTKSTQKTDATLDAPAGSETAKNGGDEQPKSEESSRANGGRRNQGRLSSVIRQHPVS